MSDKCECNKQFNERIEFKLILLGKWAVGKTCLIHRYIHNRFNADTPNSFGIAFYSQKLVMDNKRATLMIWDTAGQERFNAVTSYYIRNAKAAIICVDVTDKESYIKMNTWIDQLMVHDNTTRIYICCTKNDLVTKANRVIAQKDIEERADSCRAKVFVTSSKTGDGVSQLFRQIATDLMDNEYKTDEQHIKLTGDESMKKKWRTRCCSRK